MNDKQTKSLAEKLKNIFLIGFFLQGFGWIGYAIHVWVNSYSYIEWEVFKGQVTAVFWTLFILSVMGGCIYLGTYLQRKMQSEMLDLPKAWLAASRISLNNAREQSVWTQSAIRLYDHENKNTLELPPPMVNDPAQIYVSNGQKQLPRPTYDDAEFSIRELEPFTQDLEFSRVE